MSENERERMREERERISERIRKIENEKPGENGRDRE